MEEMEIQTTFNSDSLIDMMEVSEDEEKTDSAEE